MNVFLSINPSVNLFVFQDSNADLSPFRPVHFRKLYSNKN